MILLKKSFIISIIIAVSIALSVLVSPLISRISYEENNLSLTAALNLNCVAALFDEEELTDVLEDYKKSGINALLIREVDALSLKEAGLISYYTYSEYKKEYGDTGDERNSFIILCKSKEASEYMLNAFRSKYNDTDYTVFQKDGKTGFEIHKEITSPEAITFAPPLSLFEAAKKADLPIALSLEDNGFVNDNYRRYIEKISKEYDIKYFNPTKHEKVEAKYPYTPEAPGEWNELLKDSGRILVLNETITQLSNQKPDGYDEYIRLSRGRIQRCFKTYKSSYIDRPDYDIGYYQMLNSLADRNIRFFNISQLNDGEDNLFEKAERTQRAVKKFTQRASELGFSTERAPDFSGYNTNLRLISASAMLLMTVMGIIFAFFFFGKRKKEIERIILMAAVLGILGAFFLPFGVMLLYSTLFAVVAPCFALMMAVEFAVFTRSRLKGFVFGAANIIFSVALLSILGLVMSALLSGTDYYINTLTFKGVKTSLSAPLILSGLLFIILERKPEGGYGMRKLPKIRKEDIKPSHIILGICALAVIAVYLFRSGNAKIPFEEIWFRNFITEKLIARPRTKEFLFAWPCYILFLYFIKTEKSEILTALTGVGASILFASVVNTFCHVFTQVRIMELRVIYGAIFGLPVSLAALAVVSLFFLIIRKKNH